jgi:hypothetical protein
MFAFGVPLSLFGPLLLATMFWLTALLLRISTLGRDYLPWPWFFGIAVVVVVPLLYRLELRTGGDYLGDVSTAGEPLGPHGWSMMPMMTGRVVGVATILANPRQVSGGIVEIFLFGPRMVIGAYRQAKLARHLRTVDIDRAAGVILSLRCHKEGVDFPQLLHKGEKLEDLMPALAYLSFHKWIGAADGWHRIWLFTESRELLDRQATMPDAR